MESNNRMHQTFSRVCTLLCRNHVTTSESHGLGKVPYGHIVFGVNDKKLDVIILLFLKEHPEVPERRLQGTPEFFRQTFADGIECGFPPDKRQHFLHIAGSLKVHNPPVNVTAHQFHPPHFVIVNNFG